MSEPTKKKRTAPYVIAGPGQSSAVIQRSIAKFRKMGIVVPGIFEEAQIKKSDPRKIRNTVAYLVEVYSSKENAAYAERYYDKAKESYEKSLEYLRACGLHLRALKAQKGHGEWLEWIKTSFVKSERTAQYYMSLDENWDKAKLNGSLSLRRAARQIAECHAGTKPKEEKNGTGKKKTGAKGRALMKTLLKEAFEDWKPEEKEWLEANFLDGDWQAQCNDILRAAFRMIRTKTQEMIRRSKNGKAHKA